MSETYDSGINVTQISEISNDLDTVSVETRFESPTPYNGYKIHKGDYKLSLDSSSVVNYESEYVENCSYGMIHSPTTDQGFSFATRYGRKC